MDTTPFSANGFAPGSHPSTITRYPALPQPVYLFVSGALKLGGMRKGCMRRKKWRAGGLVAGAGGFAIRSSRVCDFHPLTPPSAFTQNPPSQEGERAFYKYNYETVGINTTRQMDSSAETDRLDGEIK